MFDVTAEERDEIIRVLAEDESEAVGSMGDDTPMPVLSHKLRSLYDYFRQQFAQVTNPPIDPLREIDRHVAVRRRSAPSATCSCRCPSMRARSCSSSPILSQRKLRQILASEEVVEANEFLDLQYEPAEGLQGARSLRICDQAETAVREGKLVLLLSDRYLRAGQAAGARAAGDRRGAPPPGARPACAASATCWSRPAPRATRITSPA